MNKLSHFFFTNLYFLVILSTTLLMTNVVYSESNFISKKIQVKNNTSSKDKITKQKLEITKGTYLLTYSELMLLKKKDRYNYLRYISKILIQMSSESKKTAIEIFFSKVYASEGFRCIGGGVPVPAGTESCGVQSYAGFSCESGNEICNPLLFGVKEDGSPFCFTNATTELCYKSIRVGIDSSMDLVYQKSKQTAYNSFYSDINNICYHAENENAEPKVEMAENILTLRHACNLVRKQTQINQERILPGAYYQSSADEITVTPLPTLPSTNEPVAAPAIEEPVDGIQ